MLCPALIAAIASSRTGAGTGVSQTPCARLMPPIRSQATVMARISDCIAPGASSLRARRVAAGAVDMGKPRLVSCTLSPQHKNCCHSERRLAGYMATQSKASPELADGDLRLFFAAYALDLWDTLLHSSYRISPKR